MCIGLNGGHVCRSRTSKGLNMPQPATILMYLSSVFYAFNSLLPISSSAAETFSGRVVGVIDGDTIRVTHDLKSVKVRLYGVDCPEIKQTGGKAARALVRRLALGRVLLIESKGEDRYKRVIGRVYMLSGETLSQELVKAGRCWWYRKYAPDDQYLKELEAEARAEKRGLWKKPNPIPPWEWRKQRRR
jgi:micrococcal nuclease